MPGLAAAIRRHPVVAYVVSTFVLSWGAMLAAIGTAGGMRGTTPASDPRFAYALLGMLLGPSASALLLTAGLDGRAGLRHLARRLITWRLPARWYAVALATAPLLMVASLTLLATRSAAFAPGVVASGRPGSLVLVSAAVGVLAGAFEELGWTGFATPRLRRRHGVAATGVILGLCWSAWHLLPNLWAARAAAGDLPVPVYLAGTVAGLLLGYLTAFRILMVWVYDRTRSVLVAVLMHVSLTAGLLALNPLDLTGARLLLYTAVLSIAVWTTVAAVALTGSRRLPIAVPEGSPRSCTPVPMGATSRHSTGRP